MAEVQRHLGALSVAATLEGNEDAARAIVSLAAALCGDVRGIAGAQPKIAEKIARERTSWPLLCDAHPEMFARNIRWLKLLPLNQASGWKKPGRKPYSFRTPENGVVQIALLAVKGKPSVAALVSKGEEMVMGIKGHPLRKKGETWAKSAAQRVGAHSHSAAAFENNVRTRVRELLRNAARSLLSVPPE
jgi:hypothetical protein